jgi:hypothetical protein
MPENRLVPLRPEPATTTSERAASVVDPGKTGARVADRPEPVDIMDAN